MTIIEAIKSGKRFKRKDLIEWFEPGHVYIEDANSNCHFRPSIQDILADDWEIEEEKIWITQSQFLRAFADGMKLRFSKKNTIIQNYHDVLENNLYDVLTEVMEELGFNTRKGDL